MTKLNIISIVRICEKCRQNSLLPFPFSVIWLVIPD